MELSRVGLVVLVLSLVLLNCSDDDEGSRPAADAGEEDAPTDAPANDTGNGSDSAAADTAVTDTGVDSGADTPDETGADAEDPDTDPEPECFEFSLEPDEPLAIDGTFDADSEVWRRPYDEEPRCPASALLPETAALVPFVAFAFCNQDTVEHTFNFEMLSQADPDGGPALDDPFLVLYEGTEVPADSRQCAAINDDIPDSIGVSDSEITGVTVPPGGAITMVGTTYTFDPNDGTGVGYYILVVSAVD